MEKKNIVFVIILLVLIAGGVIFISFTNKKESVLAPETQNIENYQENNQNSYTDETQVDVSNNTTSESATDQSGVGSTSVSGGYTLNTGSSKEKTYTMAEVATHGSESDCWSVIDSNVYDLSSFVGKHPGGKEILKICGIDGTSIFRAQHDHGKQQENILAGLKIGVLAQ